MDNMDGTQHAKLLFRRNEAFGGKALQRKYNGYLTNPIGG